MTQYTAQTSQPLLRQQHKLIASSLLALLRQPKRKSWRLIIPKLKQLSLLLIEKHIFSHLTHIQRFLQLIPPFDWDQTYGSHKDMKRCNMVYILFSLSHSPPKHFYIGCTQCPLERWQTHLRHGLSPKTRSDRFANTPTMQKLYRFMQQHDP